MLGIHLMGTMGDDLLQGDDGILIVPSQLVDVRSGRGRWLDLALRSGKNGSLRYDMITEEEKDREDTGQGQCPGDPRAPPREGNRARSSRRCGHRHIQQGALDGRPEILGQGHLGQVFRLGDDQPQIVQGLSTSAAAPKVFFHIPRPNVFELTLKIWGK
jgi:hypothetical protein